MSLGMEAQGDSQKDSAYYKLYRLWNMIKHRCYNKEGQDYANYGGRGITVCQEWLDSYITFKEWALNNGWQEGLQIDRINNNLGYAPDNCRFVTSKINNNNRRNNAYMTYNGETHTAMEWAEKLGLDYTTIINRRFGGLPVEKILSKDPLPHNIKPCTVFLTYHGKTLPLKDWAYPVTDCTYKELITRRYGGWTDEEIIDVPRGMPIKIWRAKRDSN
jgi:hypothetical protein